MLCNAGRLIHEDDRIIARAEGKEINRRRVEIPDEALEGRIILHLLCALEALVRVLLKACRLFCLHILPERRHSFLFFPADFCKTLRKAAL